MSIIDTQLFQFVFKVLVTIGFLIICKGLWASAMESLKRTNSWKSVIDEIALGIVVIFIYFIIVSSPPSTLFNYIKEPIIFLWNMLTGFLRETLGLPI